MLVVGVSESWTELERPLVAACLVRNDIAESQSRITVSDMLYTTSQA